MSLIVVALFVSAQAAAPESTMAPPAAASVPAPKVKEKKICKTEEAESGSHMSKRLCLTEQQWAERGRTMYDNSRSGITGAAQDH